MPMAALSASTALGNSIMAPSPVSLISRPLRRLTMGSIHSERCAFRRKCVPLSSTLIRRAYPTTSSTMIAVSRRITCSVLTVLPGGRLDEARDLAQRRAHQRFNDFAPAAQYLVRHIERDPDGRPAGTRGDKAGHKNATGQSRLPELGVGRTVAYIISEPMQRCTAELPLQPGGEIARRTSLKTPACT